MNSALDFTVENMEHIDALIDDYILDILTEKERQAAEMHIRNCSRCRQKIVKERKRTRKLVNELCLVSTPPAGRIEALLPSIMMRTGLENSLPVRGWPQLRAVFTTLALALFVLAGVLGTMNNQDGWFMHTYTPTRNMGTSQPTALTTATGSHTPVLPSLTAVVQRGEWGTPEPVISVPQPRPEITAIPRATR
ncbi:MAG: zf-HC2 domain-containing protein [Anaerolineales bacterium]|nr:zf-HC2 domain-containing protein [Anaerolineales bacterium]